MHAHMSATAAGRQAKQQTACSHPARQGSASSGKVCDQEDPATCDGSVHERGGRPSRAACGGGGTCTTR